MFFTQPNENKNAKLIVVEAIKNADAIILGPGSLYTDVLPNLLVKNIAKKIPSILLGGFLVIP